MKKLLNEKDKLDTEEGIHYEKECEVRIVKKAKLDSEEGIHIEKEDK